MLQNATSVLVALRTVNYCAVKLNSFSQSHELKLHVQKKYENYSFSVSARYALDFFTGTKYFVHRDL